MAFRKKAHAIVGLEPDILVVPECESPDKLMFDIYAPKPRHSLWYGTNPNKGLGIFSYSNFKFKELDCHNRELKMVVPIEVSNGEEAFTLFAIWANNTNDKQNQYVGQIWKALAHYDSLLSRGPLILVGDFNSNSIWDKPKRIGNHTHVVEKLLEKDIHSCYHKHTGDEQGKEGQATLYMYRDNNKGYHIDYCFASQEYIQKLNSVEVGDFTTWSKYSDHMPLIIDFKNSKAEEHSPK
jgi:exodeoxyribonuclease-3